MQIPNRDLFATDLTQEQYRDIEPLIVSPLLDEQFKKHERAATKAKRRYHYLGQTAIVLVAASAIFTVAEVLILPDFLNNVYLKFVAVIMAGTETAQMHEQDRQRRQTLEQKIAITDRIETVKGDT